MSNNNALIIKEDCHEIPTLYRSTETRLGTRVVIADKDQFIKRVQLLDTDGTVNYIHPINFMTGSNEIDRVMRPFLISCLQKYMPQTMVAIDKEIEKFTSNFIETKDVNDAISSTIIQFHKEEKDSISHIRRLLKWFIAYEVEGLNLDLCEEIEELVFGGGQNSYLSLYSLDPENGPFTREELRILQSAALNNEFHLENRVCLKLCLEFGLRPIQIALLKQSDFTHDSVLKMSYLKIPRVKQKAKVRRSEFTTRLLSPELSQMIAQLIDIHSEVYREFNLNDAPLIMRRHIHGGKLNITPYVLSGDATFDDKLIRNKHPFLEEYIDSGLEEISNHIGANSISYRLEMIAQNLPNSPRTGRPFKMNPYRFRYTLGTNAVTQGMTEIEVAELLDHSAFGSVKHYFHYSQEMFEILEESTLDRVENKFFTAAWRKEDVYGNIYGEQVVEPRTAIAIGKCQKNAPCVLEPAVACYQCDKFCPNKNVDGHEKQLKSLKDRAAKAAQVSNREVVHQFDEAIAGCEAAVQYAKGEAVIAVQSDTATEYGLGKIDDTHN